MVELKGSRKYAAYGALFLVAFLVALRQTFPTEAVRERLVMEAAAQGWQMKVADTGPAGLLGVRFTAMSLESRDGVRIPIEELRASARLWPLLLGRRGFDFDARLYDGRVKGSWEERSGGRRWVVAHLSGLELGRATAIRKATGLDLGGTLGGELDVLLDGREPARSQGLLDLKLEKAALLGGQLQLAALGGALTLPRADLGQVVAHATIQEGKAAFDKLEAKGADVELRGEGIAVTLQQRLSYSPVFGKAQLKLQDAFWMKSGTSGLRAVTESTLAPSRGRDGSYHFQVFGTLAQPQARPGQ